MWKICDWIVSIFKNIEYVLNELGPMVWYQMFEYAIGHWLQKATEHMIGCVLCSPGCFSLFRGKALMDDNVMKKYTTRSDEARHYVQYDQGEDRWLCTLLLQRGYRVRSATFIFKRSKQNKKITELCIMLTQGRIFCGKWRVHSRAWRFQWILQSTSTMGTLDNRKHHGFTYGC